VIGGGFCGAPTWIQYARDWGGLGDEGDDAHVGAVVGAEQR
jgi:hypothetical protein